MEKERIIWKHFGRWSGIAGATKGNKATSMFEWEGNQSNYPLLEIPVKGGVVRIQKQLQFLYYYGFQIGFNLRTYNGRKILKKLK